MHTLELPARDRELHTWAAAGLANTCWASYLDQASGLGPDEMRMKAWKPAAEGRWMKHVARWEKEGRSGGVPPGVGDPRREEKAKRRDYGQQKGTYLLRPEVCRFPESWSCPGCNIFVKAIESFYLLWRTTGDEKWRERGWAVFQSIEKHAKTPHGYASLNQVDVVPPPLIDSMPR